MDCHGRSDDVDHGAGGRLPHQMDVALRQVLLCRWRGVGDDETGDSGSVQLAAELGAMNTEVHKFSEHCELAIFGLLQSQYDLYRLKNNLPQQPVQFATKEEKEAIRSECQ